mmetsp:Transcript_29818/g.84029  ORF Transcript_29818/g.84029 Transcript_29818/m.84029 type:complete len:167 (+) Transcript_29818:859-1359(+)
MVRLEAFFPDGPIHFFVEAGTRRNSTDDGRNSLDGIMETDQIHPAASENAKFQPGVKPGHGNVWESVFNPGKNMNLKKAPASYFDNPGESKATTWDHVLKAENVKRLAFSQIDKNGDGFIDASELRHELQGSSLDINQLIKQADKNGDGKIDFAEFSDLFRNSPSA